MMNNKPAPLAPSRTLIRQTLAAKLGRWLVHRTSPGRVPASQIVPFPASLKHPPGLTQTGKNHLPAGPVSPGEPLHFPFPRRDQP